MKERLLGAAVLIVAAVLLIPAFLDGPRVPETVSSELALPMPDAGTATPTGAEANRTHTVEIDTSKAKTLPDPVVMTSDPAPPPAVPPTRSPVGEPSPEAKPPASKAVVAKPLPPADGWAVQVGSFTSESNARRLMEHLKDDGYPAFVVRNVVNGRVMFRVRVGPEADRLRAEALVERLKSDRQQTQLVRHP